MPGNLKVRTAAVTLQFCLARGAFKFWLEYKIPQKSSLYANTDNDSSVLGSDQCYSSLITIKSNTDTRKTNLTLNRIPPLPAPLLLPTEPSFFQIRMCQCHLPAPPPPSPNSLLVTKFYFSSMEHIPLICSFLFTFHYGLCLSPSPPHFLGPSDTPC